MSNAMPLWFFTRCAENPGAGYAVGLPAANVVMAESLSDVVTGVVVVCEFVVTGSCFVEVLSDVVVEALAFGIGVEVLADVRVNVSPAVMTALEFLVPIL